jgi:hypothetical protein
MTNKRRVFLVTDMILPVVQLAYEPPREVQSLPYALSVRKRAGTPPWPTYLSTGRCHWDGWLDTDRRFECPVGVE